MEHCAARRAGTFVAQLQARQRAAGLSQQELARRLGVHETAVSLLFTGRRGYSLEFARAAVRVWPELAVAVAADLAFPPAAPPPAERGPPPPPE